MSRTVKVSWTYEFQIDTEHASMFEGMTEQETLQRCAEMAEQDLAALTYSNELADAATIEMETN